MAKSENQIYTLDVFTSSPSKFEAVTGISFDSELGKGIRGFIDSCKDNFLYRSSHVAIGPTHHGLEISVESRRSTTTIDIIHDNGKPSVDSISVDNGDRKVIYDMSNLEPNEIFKGSHINTNVDRSEFNRDGILQLSVETKDDMTIWSRFSDGTTPIERVITQETETGSIQETHTFDNGVLTEKVVHVVDKVENDDVTRVETKSTFRYDTDGNSISEKQEITTYRQDGEREINTTEQKYENDHPHVYEETRLEKGFTETGDNQSNEYTSICTIDRSVDGVFVDRITMETHSIYDSDDNGFLNQTKETITHSIGDKVVTIQIDSTERPDYFEGDNTYTEYESVTETTQFSDGAQTIREYDPRAFDRGFTPFGEYEVSLDGSRGSYVEKCFNSQGELSEKTTHCEFWQPQQGRVSLDSHTHYEHGVRSVTKNETLHGTEIIRYDAEGKIEIVERYSETGDLLTTVEFTYTDAEITRTTYNQNDEVISVVTNDVSDGDMLLSALDNNEYSLQRVKDGQITERYIYVKEATDGDNRQPEIIVVEYGDNGRLLSEEHRCSLGDSDSGEIYRRVDYSSDGEVEKVTTKEKLSGEPVVEADLSMKQEVYREETIIYENGEPHTNTVMVESLCFSITEGSQYITEIEKYSADGVLVEKATIYDFQGSVSNDARGHDREIQRYNPETGEPVERVQIDYDPDTKLETVTVEGDNYGDNYRTDLDGNVLDFHPDLTDAEVNEDADVPVDPYDDCGDDTQDF